jgi:hypothetical protein
MSYRKDVFSPDNFEEVKDDLIKMKDTLHIKQNKINNYN